MSQKNQHSPGEKVIARNKRASFDYTLLTRFEAGVVLQGSEVKMLRHGSADLTDAWCSIKNGEAFIEGINVPEYPGTPFGHKPKRPRKLLLHAREIEIIRRGIEREGMTVVATQMYFKEGLVKVEIYLAKGKKKFDKRQSLKDKDAEREARAAITRVIHHHRERQE